MLLTGGLLLTLAGAFPLTAQTTPIGLRISGASVTEKDTFTVDIVADSLFTGRNVYSFQFQIGYNPYYFEFLGLAATGPVLSPWGGPMINVPNPGTIRIAGAGADSLTGNGIMLSLRFVARNTGGQYITFNNAESYLNERNPEVLLSNGYVDIAARSYPNIYPDQQVMFVGDEVRMSVSGGTAPFVYSVVDPTVAVITGQDTVRAIGPGTTRIRVTDINGDSSLTTGVFDVRAVHTDLGVTNVWPEDTFYLPLKVEIAPGNTLFSGRVEILHSNGLSGLTGETGIGDYQLVIENKDDGGKMTISFASTTGISGTGILCYLGFRANYSGNHQLWFGQSRFNENLLGLPVQSAYYVTVNSLPNLTFSPSSGALMWGSTQKITVYNGTPPYTYGVSDTTVAGVDDLGVLSALSGGKVSVTVRDAHGATGTTGLFTVYDHRVYMDTTDGVPDQDTRVPVLTTSLPAGKSVMGYEFTASYDTTLLDFVRMDPAGTGMLTQAVRQGNVVRVAAASAQGIQSGLLGFLVYRIRNTMPLNSITPVSLLSFSGNENKLSTTLEGGFVRRVTQVSYRPVAKAGNDFSLLEGSQGQLDGAGSYDYDGDSLRYVWRAPAGITLDDTTAVRPHFTAPWVNDDTPFNFTLLVSDGTQFSDPDQVQVTVLQINHAPVANAGNNKSYAEGSTVSLDGSGSYDPDGDALSYQWNSLDGIILFNSTGVNPTFILPQVTENISYRFTLTVHDGVLYSSTDTVVITDLQVNQKPVAFAGGDFSVEEQATGTLDGSLSYDADSDPLHFQWFSPPGIVLSSDTISKPSFTAPAVHRDSVLIFTLVVNDGSKDSDPDDVRVTITNLDSLSSDALIDSVMLAGMDSFAIDTSISRVQLYVPYGFDISTLAPDFILSKYASINPAGGSIHDFSVPVYYQVTAEDGVTVRLWTVEVVLPERTMSRQLQQGWNWISLNVNPADRSISSLFNPLSLTDLDYIKSSDYSSTWYTATGWFGDLTVFPENRMIKFRKSVPEPFSVTGREINPTLESIPLIEGWNSVAYLLRSDALINSAIQQSSIPAGNVVLKGETGSAVYFNGTGWAGEIDTLRILHGYKLHVDQGGALRYNALAAPPKNSSVRLYSRRELLENYSLNPHQFEYSSTVIAEVVDAHGMNQTGKGDLLGAFAGNDCRGISEAVHVAKLNKYIFILTCFGNTPDELINLKMIAYADKKEYNTFLSLPFHPDEILGQPAKPIQLTVSGITGNSDPEQPSGFYLFPNPARDHITVSSVLTIEEISVCNIMGKEVYREEFNKNLITIPMNELPSGVYIVRVKAKDHVLIRKVIKTTY